MNPVRLLVTAALAAAALLAGPVRPTLADGRRDDPGVIVYPSAAAANEAALAAALANPDNHTVLFTRGTHIFSSPIFAFRRTGVRFCGETGDPSDVTIQSSVNAFGAFVVDEATRISFEDLSIENLSAFGACVELRSNVSAAADSFAGDVSVRNCRLSGAVGVFCRERAFDVEVVGCRIEVTRASGSGVRWEDGEGLYVARNRFTAADSVAATAAVLVRGALSPDSDGDRARRILLVSNRVEGNFEVAFNLSDVVDVRVQRNRIEFDDAAQFIANGAGTADDERRGRRGIVIQRASASKAPDDLRVFRNRVRSAHTGVWLFNVDGGSVEANDLRTSGDAADDTFFGDGGCALRVSLLGDQCRVRVDGNDFRRLRSVAPRPAVSVTPAGFEGLCFENRTPPVSNRVDDGRVLYQGAP